MGFGVRAPPAKTDLVDEDMLVADCLFCVKSPKFTASPNVVMVTNEIIFVLSLSGKLYPAAKRPLMELPPPHADDTTLVKSPKSAALPVLAIVINSIVKTRH